MPPLPLNGRKFVNHTPLKAIVKALMRREPVGLPRDIFHFEVALHALYDGVSLEEISQTARDQLATGIVRETVRWANGNHALAAKLLQIDDITLEGWMAPQRAYSSHSGCAPLMS